MQNNYFSELSDVISSGLIRLRADSLSDVEEDENNADVFRSVALIVFIVVFPISSDTYFAVSKPIFGKKILVLTASIIVCASAFS